MEGSEPATKAKADLPCPGCSSLLSRIGWARHPEPPALRRRLLEDRRTAVPADQSAVRGEKLSEEWRQRPYVRKAFASGNDAEFNLLAFATSGSRPGPCGWRNPRSGWVSSDPTQKGDDPRVDSARRRRATGAASRHPQPREKDRGHRCGYPWSTNSARCKDPVAPAKRSPQSNPCVAGGSSERETLFHGFEIHGPCIKSPTTSKEGPGQVTESPAAPGAAVPPSTGEAAPPLDPWTRTSRARRLFDGLVRGDDQCNGDVRADSGGGVAGIDSFHPVACFHFGGERIGRKDPTMTYNSPDAGSAGCAGGGKGRGERHTPGLRRRRAAGKFQVWASSLLLRQATPNANTIPN
jgi:hypothetical protein